MSARVCFTSLWWGVSYTGHKVIFNNISSHIFRYVANKHGLCNSSNVLCIEFVVSWVLQHFSISQTDPYSSRLLITEATLHNLSESINHKQLLITHIQQDTMKPHSYRGNIWNRVTVTSYERHVISNQWQLDWLIESLQNRSFAGVIHQSSWCFFV